MNKVVSEKHFRGLQDLQIDKVSMYKEVRITNMSQHLSHKSKLSHVDWVIKGKVDGPTGSPPIFKNLQWLRRRR